MGIASHGIANLFPCVSQGTKLLHQMPRANAKSSKDQSNFPVADQLPERHCPNALPKKKKA
jgi:hypothetical protein